MSKKLTFREEVTEACIRKIRANGAVCPECGRRVKRDRQSLVEHAEGIEPDCGLRADVASEL